MLNCFTDVNSVWMKICMRFTGTRFNYQTKGFSYSFGTLEIFTNLQESNVLIFLLLH